MGGIKKMLKSVVGTATGGLLMKPDVPKMRMAKDNKSALDPQYGAQVSAAKRRKIAAAGAAGRSSFRIDLSSGSSGSTSGQTRGGITIG